MGAVRWFHVRERPDISDSFSIPTSAISYSDMSDMTSLSTAPFGCERIQCRKLTSGNGVELDPQERGNLPRTGRAVRRCRQVDRRRSRLTDSIPLRCRTIRPDRSHVTWGGQTACSRQNMKRLLASRSTSGYPRPMTPEFKQQLCEEIDAFLAVVKWLRGYMPE